MEIINKFLEEKLLKSLETGEGITNISFPQDEIALFSYKNLKVRLDYIPNMCRIYINPNDEDTFYQNYQWVLTCKTDYLRNLYKFSEEQNLKKIEQKILTMRNY